MRLEPVPELFPLTGAELSEDVIEILTDLFTSRGSELCQDSCASKDHVCTQDRDRTRPLKRSVKVSMRNLTRADRDALTAAKGVGFVVGQGSNGTDEESLKSARSNILRARWVLTWKNGGTEKVPQAQLCALGFQDPFHHTSHHLRP